MSKFLPSMVGTKRALTNKVLREIFDHWNEIEEKTGKTGRPLNFSPADRAERI
jgi:protein-disulfide isomerase-like protein with CxxC motif